MNPNLDLFLFAQMPVMAFLVELDGTILTVSNCVEKHLGYTPSELVGQSVAMVFSSSEHQLILSSLNGQWNREKWDFQKICKNGKRIWVTEYIQTIEFDNRQIQLIICIDTTSNVNQIDSLADKAIQLIKAKKELENLAEASAHDLRQPTRVVGGAFKLLKERFHKQMSEQDIQLLEIGEKGIRRINVLQEQIFTYLQITEANIIRTRHNLEQPLEVALIQLKELINSSGAIVTYEKPMPDVFSSLQSLVMVFQNLIQNAIRFKKDDSIPEIKVSFEKNERDLVVCVADNGIGIEKEYVEYVFGLFKRLHNDQYAEGTGFGLALCRKIMDELAGKIWITSILNEGTSVYFTIPLSSTSKNLTKMTR